MNKLISSNFEICSFNEELYIKIKGKEREITYIMWYKFQCAVEQSSDGFS